MIYGVFGMPRSGKTTFLARYLKLNWEKYNHIYISGEQLLPDCGIPDDMVTYIEPYAIGGFRPILGSLFVLCEAGTYFNNRLVNKIPKWCTNFFALHGHYASDKCPCDIIWDSQSVDIDKKLRDRTNFLYIAKKSVLPHVTHLRYIAHNLDVNEDTKSLEEIYTYNKLLMRIAYYLVRRSLIMYRKSWYGVFDTHSDILFDEKGVLKPEWR